MSSLNDLCDLLNYAFYFYIHIPVKLLAKLACKLFRKTHTTLQKKTCESGKNNYFNFLSTNIEFYRTPMFWIVESRDFKIR